MTDSKRIKQIEKKIRKAADAYYNSGKPLMSDAEFDALVEKLKNLKPNSKVLDEIGSPVKKKKVKLEYFLGSLDKIKEDTADTWLMNNDNPYGYFVSEKLDGVSALIVYTKEGIRAYTRGDGTYGQDISHLVKYLDIPDFKTNLVLRGEIIMPVDTFESKWEDSFKNPRNLVSALVNRKKIHKAIKDCDVVIYEQLYPRKNQADVLTELKDVGFSVVSGKVYKRLTAGTLTDLLVKRKEKSKYEVDGLVVTMNKNNPVNTSGNPKWAVAFKSNLSSELEAKVVAVHWKISKNGYLKPRVEIEPVELNSVKITYATGFNAKYIKQNRIGPGARVTIVRSGDVIPYITGIVRKARKSQMPDKETFGKMKWSGVELRATQAEGHSEYHVKRITWFLKTIGVEHVSEGLVRRFYENGLTTIRKVTMAEKEVFLDMDGVKDALAEKIYSNIQNKITNIELPRLMAASGFFPNLAIRRLKVITDAYPKILTDYKKLPAESLARKINKLEGYSDKMTKVFVDNLSNFDTWLTRQNHITYKVEKRKKRKAGPLTNEVIVFTGFRDRQSEIIIEEKGGKVASSISGNTTLLVVKDLDKPSTKLDKARELGIKVMDLNDFQRWLSTK